MARIFNPQIVECQSSVYVFSSWPSASLLSIWQHIKLSQWGRLGAAWFSRGNFLSFLKCVTQVSLRRHPHPAA